MRHDALIPEIDWSCTIRLSADTVLSGISLSTAPKGELTTVEVKSGVASSMVTTTLPILTSFQTCLKSWGSAFMALVCGPASCLVRAMEDWTLTPVLRTSLRKARRFGSRIPSRLHLSTPASPSMPRLARSVHIASATRWGDPVAMSRAWPRSAAPAQFSSVLVAPKT